MDVKGRVLPSVRAPALAVDYCSSESTFVNFSSPLSPKDREQIKAGGLAGDRTIFNVAFTPLNGTHEKLESSTTMGSQQVSQKCAGPLVTTNCYLVSAIAEYPVITKDAVISLAEIPYSPRIVAYANNTAITDETIFEYGLNNGHGGIYSTLAGIATAANYQFFIQLELMPSPAGFIAVGPLTWFTFEHMPGYTDIETEKYCAPKFTDPRPDVMSALNELVFRTGVYTALNYDENFFKAHLDDGLQVHYNVTGQKLSPVNAFHSDFRYFAAAASAQLFTVLVILITFWGWWRLGRKPSFSPLKVAKVSHQWAML